MDGASFVEQARGAAFDLTGDDGVADRKRTRLSWDKKKKKFIKGDGEGADNIKMVKTENGTKLPASYRSGRFDEWKSKTRTSLPRVGEAEIEGRRGGSQGGKRFKHNKVTSAKPLDKLSKDYDRKVRQIKKRDEGEGLAEKSQSVAKGGKGLRGKKLGGRYNGKTVGRVKSELKNAEQIRKSRKIMEQKRAKNARPSKRKGRR
jgi:ATP-dependent RNA helicase DDX54/DBP10